MNKKKTKRVTKCRVKFNTTPIYTTRLEGLEFKQKNANVVLKVKIKNLALKSALKVSYSYSYGLQWKKSKDKLTKSMSHILVCGLVPPLLFQVFLCYL